MKEEQELIYFFDDHIQLIKVADELFELYADSIDQAKFMPEQCGCPKGWSFFRRRV